MGFVLLVGQGCLRLGPLLLAAGPVGHQVPPNEGSTSELRRVKGLISQWSCSHLYEIIDVCILKSGLQKKRKKETGLQDSFKFCPSVYGSMFCMWLLIGPKHPK
jgi:hypothetical protein